MIKAGNEGKNFDYAKEGLSIPISRLYLEVTRRCNMTCAHCMRGDAQDRVMSRQVVDTTLDQVSEIGTLLLTGGEPFLVPGIIDYIIDGIIERDIPIRRIHIVTNGSILDKRIARSVNKITEYIHNRGYAGTDPKRLRMIGDICISHDAYHRDVDIPAALKFYRQELNKHTIIRRETEKNHSIFMMGRALANKDMFDKSIRKYKVCPHRVELNSSSIITSIQIGYDGKVLIGEDSSYDQQDKDNYGNILSEPLSCLLYNNVYKIPFDKTESMVYDAVYTKWINGNEDYQAYVLYLDLIRAIRERIKYVYPFLSWQDVAEAAYNECQMYLHHKAEIDMDMYDTYTLGLRPHKTIAECEQAQKDLFLRGMRHDPIGTLLRRSRSLNLDIIDSIRSLGFKPIDKIILRPEF